MSLKQVDDWRRQGRRTGEGWRRMEERRGRGESQTREQPLHDIRVERINLINRIGKSVVRIRYISCKMPQHKTPQMAELQKR